MHNRSELELGAAQPTRAGARSYTTEASWSSKLHMQQLTELEFFFFFNVSLDTEQFFQSDARTVSPLLAQVSLSH